MIFVAGGTGFLGSHLLYNLIQLGRPVRAMYRNEEGLDYFRKYKKYYPEVKEHWLDQIEWVQGDIRDYYTLSEYLTGITQVYHLAGIVSFKKKDNRKLFDINVQGTANLVNACLQHNIARLCHVSSISALGDPDDNELIDENHLWNRNSSASPYARSKFRGEMEVWRGIHEGLNAVIVNPSVIFGPGMWYGSAASVFEQVYRGLAYYPTGSSGYVDVHDVVQAMISLTDNDVSGERFIVSAENLTHREVIGYMAKIMNRPSPVRPLTPLLINMACQFEKMRSLFTGQPPRITRRSMQISTSVTSYSNYKIVKALSFQFVPVKDTIISSTRLFMDECVGKS